MKRINKEEQKVEVITKETFNGYDFHIEVETNGITTPFICKCFWCIREEGKKTQTN